MPPAHPPPPPVALRLTVTQGRIQNFQGGGAQEIMCAHAYYEQEARGPFTARVQLSGILMLSGANWALFVSILKQNRIEKTHTVVQILGGDLLRPL